MAQYCSVALQRVNDNKARIKIEMHKDGYNNEGLMKRQVERAVDIFEAKYPHALV